MPEAQRLLIDCGAMVDVDSETQRLLVEFLRTIHVRDGNDDSFLFEIHYSGSLNAIIPLLAKLVLFTESLDVRFAIRVEKLLAAFLPRRFEVGRCDVPVRPAFLEDRT